MAMRVTCNHTALMAKVRQEVSKTATNKAGAADQCNFCKFHRDSRCYFFQGYLIQATQ